MRSRHQTNPPLHLISAFFLIYRADGVTWPSIRQRRWPYRMPKTLSRHGSEPCTLRPPATLRELPSQHRTNMNKEKTTNLVARGGHKRGKPLASLDPRVRRRLPLTGHDRESPCSPSSPRAPVHRGFSREHGQSPQLRPPLGNGSTPFPSHQPFNLSPTHRPVMPSPTSQWPRERPPFSKSSARTARRVLDSTPCLATSDITSVLDAHRRDRLGTSDARVALALAQTNKRPVEALFFGRSTRKHPHAHTQTHPRLLPQKKTHGPFDAVRDTWNLRPRLRQTSVPAGWAQGL
ncbi:hypothetical protein CSUB01_11395 [Colletotrichum sublineola]|uniref:Uncharacterized protein n=1 Tax=Colletotrichum sublineola TaxID=1173701 RepID=A0A066X7V6_COLSU|nr:hypothetical protein CSUB01_11395 [Colletotrichum sublineola]